MINGKIQNAKKVRDIWPQSDALRLGTNWSEEDLDKYQILVDDVWGESHPGSIHLNQLSEQAAIGIWESGARPAHFHVTDICDGWAQGHDGMNYVLASREIMADMVEIHGSVWPWDGIILISSCDKSIPAHLMAAARLNLPAIHVPGGSMRPGPRMSNTILGDCSIKKKEGKITDEEVRKLQRTAAPTCGACQFMGTASTMQCMSEALGMALPGSALAPATMSVIQHIARKSGQAVVNLVKKGIKPSDILTKEAFENAIAIHAAIGGSTNALLHLPAIARELNIEISLDVFDKYNRIIPHLAWVQPNGPYPSELFWFAGGIPLVQWYLKDYLHLDVMTVTGETLRENLNKLKSSGFFDQYIGFLDNYNVSRDEIINPPEKATMMGSIAVLFGNLAPKGAVVKYSAVNKEMLIHKGPARVFNSEEEACDAVVSNKIKPGDVVIIRYEGFLGSGMPEMLMTTEALALKPELSKTTALVTDGRFSGGTRGPCIGHVSPEAAEGGPIALVENNDIIEINIPERRLNIVGIEGKYLNEEEIIKCLNERRKKWEPPKSRFNKGVMKKLRGKN
ncbi:dihydroxy-acid dehydratase [Caldanaerovirga acetigignens]|uniref:Dihydroxy-acid dehydratase n=1 Tax=Caldanaerovirga acetigignens TaxID=447595 RepID=A0A1M7H982_9FIRM|nr:dihydroxy-acid dehydratase [Caldanaerovirga acetigignens]SHM25104.1 dihydroxy-acid dehydratase [Caldanaerovirga acetigignens]